MRMSGNPFDEIFKRLSKEEFMEDPTRVLSFMLDFGFDSKQVRMIKTVMSEDMKDVKEFLILPPGSGYEIVRNIADYCLVAGEPLKKILDHMKMAMYDSVKIKFTCDENKNECRNTANEKNCKIDTIKSRNDEIAPCYTTSDSLKIINKSYYKGTSKIIINIPNSVTKIEESGFVGCKSIKEVHIPNSVIEIGNNAFVNCTSLKTINIPDSIKKNWFKCICRLHIAKICSYPKFLERDCR